MGVQPIPKLLISMSWPAILSMTIAALYNMVDSIYVSRISQDALTAISYIIPVQFLMIAVSVGTGVGVNSLIARRLGARRFDEADQAAKTSIVLALFSWLLFVFIGAFLAKPFMAAYTDDAVIAAYGAQYLSIVTIFSLCSITEIILEKVLQATGNMISPMIISMSGCITDIILDPIFIFGYFGVPRLEVRGAAIATVIGQLVAFLIGTYICFRRGNALGMNFKRPVWIFERTTAKDTLRIGFPAMLEQVFRRLGITAYTAVVSALGTNLYATHVICINIQQLTGMNGQSSSVAATR